MATGTTKIQNLVNPQVMADAVTAKVKQKIVATPFAKVDDTLVANAGDTITIPTFEYIGDAEDVAEGVECGTTILTATTTTAKVKKVMKAIELTDEAILSGYGNPVGEGTSQLGKSIASKVDADVIECAKGAQLKYTAGATAIIGYASIVNAIDLFDEEVRITPAHAGSTHIYLYMEAVHQDHPRSQLRLDKDFISADKYNNEVMMRGEIGMIGSARIVPSRKIKAVGGVYNCPILKITEDKESEDEAPAVTIFMKRDVNVETERRSLARKTDISADEIYTVAITNQSKVVVAQFKDK